MTSRFLGHNKSLVNMIFLVCYLVLVLLKTPAVVATGKLEWLGTESSTSREALVDWAGYGEEKLSTVEIGGKLLCHVGGADANRKNDIHPTPVSGASMAVFCGSSMKSKKSWARGSTDSYGEFLLDLPSHLHAIPNLEKICIVKVLTLPKSSPCRHAFTGKHKGIKLTSVGEGVRTYSTHNIHLITKPSRVQQKRRGGKRVNLKVISVL